MDMDIYFNRPVFWRWRRRRTCRWGWVLPRSDTVFRRGRQVAVGRRWAGRNKTAEQTLRQRTSCGWTRRCADSHAGRQHRNSSAAEHIQPG